MTLEPLLNIYLQAGLSALKTPYPSYQKKIIESGYTHFSFPCSLRVGLLFLGIRDPFWVLFSFLTSLRFCYEEDCPKADPLSQEGFRRLAAQLPFSKQHHSKLVCYITKELMDSENPPLVLPNGYVYSAKVTTVQFRRHTTLHLDRLANWNYFEVEIACFMWLLYGRHLKKWLKRMTAKLLVLGLVMCATILSLSRLSFHRGAVVICQSWTDNDPRVVQSDHLPFVNVFRPTCTKDQQALTYGPVCGVVIITAWSRQYDDQNQEFMQNYVPRFSFSSSSVTLVDGKQLLAVVVVLS